MATITTLGANDTGSTSRTTINDNFTNVNTDKMETSVLSTDGTLAGDSDTEVPSEKAVKTYVDGFAVPDISCRVYQDTLDTTGSSAWAQQEYQLEDFDTDTMFDIGTPTRITIKTAGKYAYGAALKVTTKIDTGVHVKLNGTTVIIENGASSVNEGTGCSVSGIYEFAVNDYLEVFAYSNGVANTTADTANTLWAYKIN